MSASKNVSEKRNVCLWLGLTDLCALKRGDCLNVASYAWDKSFTICFQGLLNKPEEIMKFDFRKNKMHITNKHFYPKIVFSLIYFDFRLEFLLEGNTV